MNLFTGIKLGFVCSIVASCVNYSNLPDGVIDVTGQLEDGSETFSGQIVGVDMTLRSNRGRVCQGKGAPNPVVLTCSDGSAASLTLTGTRADIGGTGSGTIGGRNLVVQFGPVNCLPEGNPGPCTWANIPGLGHFGPPYDNRSSNY